MAFLWFGKKKQKKTATSFTMADMVKVITENGIPVTIQEFSDSFQHFFQSIKVKLILPELMHVSTSSELTVDNSIYTLHLSFSLVDGVGNIGGLDSILPIASFYTAVSELAKVKGVVKYVLKDGERLPIFDWRWQGIKEPHPLQTLFPHFAKISLLPHYD